MCVHMGHSTLQKLGECARVAGTIGTEIADITRKAFNDMQSRTKSVKREQKSITTPHCTRSYVY